MLVTNRTIESIQARDSAACKQWIADCRNGTEQLAHRALTRCNIISNESISRWIELAASMWGVGCWMWDVGCGMDGWPWTRPLLFCSLAERINKRVVCGAISLPPTRFMFPYKPKRSDLKLNELVITAIPINRIIRSNHHPKPSPKTGIWNIAKVEFLIIFRRCCIWRPVYHQHRPSICFFFNFYLSFLLVSLIWKKCKSLAEWPTSRLQRFYLNSNGYMIVCEFHFHYYTPYELRCWLLYCLWISSNHVVLSAATFKFIYGYRSPDKVYHSIVGEAGDYPVMSHGNEKVARSN